MLTVHVVELVEREEPRVRSVELPRLPLTREMILLPGDRLYRVDQVDEHICRGLDGDGRAHVTQITEVPSAVSIALGHRKRLSLDEPTKQHLDPPATAYRLRNVSAIGETEVRVGTAPQLGETFPPVAGGLDKRRVIYVVHVPGVPVCAEVLWTAQTVAEIFR